MPLEKLDLDGQSDSAWRLVLDDYDHAMTRVIADHRGRVVNRMGDGRLATFDGPANLRRPNKHLT
jgi:class 3 adenylate cyclase